MPRPAVHTQVHYTDPGGVERVAWVIRHEVGVETVGIAFLTDNDPAHFADPNWSRVGMAGNVSEGAHGTPGTYHAMH